MNAINISINQPVTEHDIVLSGIKLNLKRYKKDKALAIADFLVDDPEEATTKEIRDKAHEVMKQFEHCKYTFEVDAVAERFIKALLA